MAAADGPVVLVVLISRVATYRFRSFRFNELASVQDVVSRKGFRRVPRPLPKTRLAFCFRDRLACAKRARSIEEETPERTRPASSSRVYTR
ncbi:hypothetical protein SCHPADRAFT_380379 [Schizopora paradoxa]|uniref:Uncharacterized protein n=1 Tax=Schizopora paradoxa TaxID=27342 RepID=A0A0H2RMQ4_9AGAM|nr:hypothetical protein SCHPADRAFT_380379 [Schizopora paradoxa]